MDSKNIGTVTAAFTSAIEALTLHPRSEASGSREPDHAPLCVPEPAAPVLRLPRRLLSPEFRPRSEPRQRPWALFLFTAAAGGSTTLTLVYKRSFEPNVAPVQTFSIQVTVDASAASAGATQG